MEKMEVNLGNTKIDVKKASKTTLEKVVLEVIKTKHEKREDILNYYFKKNKMKPYKKLNNDMSFIECSIKHDDHDMLCKYVKNLTICAPSFNIINLCVEYNKIELLKKYVKEKRITREQCINENTPLITAIKKKYVECFDILLENGCKINQPNSKGSGPVCNLFSEIIIDNKNGNISNENKIIYEKFIDGVLPVKFLMSYDQLKEELREDLNKNKKFDYTVFEKIKANLKMIVHKQKMFESDLFEILTDDENEHNNEFIDIYSYCVNKYNILYSNCETSKLITMAENGLDSFVNLILNKRPHMLYLNYDDCKVIIHLFNTKNEKIINNILVNFSHVVLYDNELLNFLTFTGKIEYVKILLNKYPECANQIESVGRTLIEAVVISKSIEEQDKIEQIDYFIKMGAVVNSINNYELSTVETAIQYSTIQVVEHLIKHTSCEFKKRNIIYFACTFEKLEILKLLVDNDFYIKFSEVNDIPSCIFPSIRLNNYPMVKYILEEPMFKITESQKKYLFDFAKKFKCTKNILCLLNENYKLNNDIENNVVTEIVNYTDNKIDKKYEIARLNGMFSNFVEKYNCAKCEILSYTKIIIMMLLKIVNNDTNNIYRRNFFEQEEKFTRNNNLLKSENEIIKCFMIILTYENINTLTSADINEIFMRAIEGNFTRSAIDTYKEILTKSKDKLEHFSITLIELFQSIINEEYESDEDDDNDYDYCPCCGNRCESDDDNEYIEYSDFDSDSDNSDNNGNSKNKKIKNKIKKTKLNKNSKANKDLLCNTSNDTISVQIEKNEFIGEKNNEIDTNECIDKDVQIDKDKQISKLNEKFIVNQSAMTYTKIIMSQELITMLLSRLTYPFIIGNYDVLKKSLSQLVTYYEDKYKFNIVENNKLVAMIHKKSKDEIPKWIETYGYNICADNKMDDNHMFTFGIDILLFDLWSKKSNAIKCKYKLINTENHATCIYINGKALINGKWQSGNFEYFLNDKNILFHRLFKPTKSHFYDCNNPRNNNSNLIA